MNRENDHSLFSTCYQNRLSEHLKFEIRSLLGRLFFNRKPPLKQSINLLNLGCGEARISGWINADFHRGLRFWKASPVEPEWRLDLRYPLKCEDGVWDGVFTEHTLEHLYPADVRALLIELLRTMKPGAWLRIVVPDLQKYIDYYNGKTPDKTFEKWPTGCEAIHALTQKWFHVSVWDCDLLLRVLGECGFVQPRRVDYRQGSDARLLCDSSARRWESLYLEARKPLLPGLNGGDETEGVGH